MYKCGISTKPQLVLSLEFPTISIISSECGIFPKPQCISVIKPPQFPMESPDGFPDASRPAAVRSGWIPRLHRRAASSAGPGRFGISHGDFPMKDLNFPWDVQKCVQKFPTNQRF